MALAVDMALQFLLLAAVLYGITLAASHAPRAHARLSVSSAESFGVAIVVGIIFVVFFGYFIAFEAFGNGQTPGKKLLGIRVVRDGGYPLDPTGSLIRNLIRIGELALGFYAVSAIVSLLSPENKRLGDMAAGTIVVRDARVQNLVALVERRAAEPHRVALISDEEHALIARFIARRKGMAPRYRQQLAAQIADRVRKRVSSDLQGLDDEGLLERLSASS